MWSNSQASYGGFCKGLFLKIEKIFLCNPWLVYVLYKRCEEACHVALMVKNKIRHNL